MSFLRFGAPLFVACTLFAASAEAKPGFSGYAGIGNQTCGACHGGGAVPTVSFKTAPTTLARGQSGAFTFSVVGSLARTTMDIAALDANGLTVALTPDNTTTKSSAGDVIPQGNYFAGASKDYSFTLTPPANAVSPVTIYAVGMATNGSGTGGDGVAKTTIQVALTGPIGGADAGAGGSDAGGSKPDGGTTSSGGTSSGATSSSSSGGASSSGGTSSSSGTSGTSGGTEGGDAGDSNSGAGPEDEFSDGAGGCSVGGSSSRDAAGIFGLLIVFVAWARRLRRS